MGYGFSFGFQMFQIMFFIVFGLILCTVIVTLIKGLKEWNNNNHSPRLTVPVTVVAKRADVTHHRHRSANDHHHYHTSTTYFVTFEVESGDRMELRLEGHEYGLLVEGDKGKLSFQGTRYLGFERT